jgi:hypothetical protein
MPRIHAAERSHLANGPVRRGWLVIVPLSAAVQLAVGCTAGTLPEPVGPGTAPIGDVSTPVPIDQLPGPGLPTHYKGLPLQLVQRPAPSITPVDGVIGVVCVGMSNAAQECGRLLASMAPGGPWNHEVSPAVRFVNCAVGGHAIERWIEPAFDPVLWDACLTTRIPQRDLRPEQVRVILHKAANQFGTGPGGFTARPDRGEPRAYEEGHALNQWLAAHSQVDGVW